MILEKILRRFPKGFQEGFSCGIFLIGILGVILGGIFFMGSSPKILAWIPTMILFHFSKDWNPWNDPWDPLWDSLQ